VELTWEDFFGEKLFAYDYSGRQIRKDAIGQDDNPFCPTFDHILPIAKGGTNAKDNLLICSVLTNQEKSDRFPTWNANGKTFQAKRIKGKRGVYKIWGDIL
jgi:hypothetical protein